MNDGDYVLGTRDDEVERLGVQARVWRARVLDAFRRARFGSGQLILDVGAGPGFVTADLADIVGPSGKVLALERSPHFAAVLRSRSLANVEVVEIDVNDRGFGEAVADGSWCRWLLAFVADPPRTVRNIAAALRPGATAVFHEYADYEAWRTFPPAPHHERFRALVVKSWRDSGGEPDIGLALPALLEDAGMEILDVRPLLEIVTADDPLWQWPASFVATGAARLVELGYATAEEGARLAACLDTLPPGTRMMTPVVAEIIARKR
jgi:SAM-dependent methyltransferase